MKSVTYLGKDISIADYEKSTEVFEARLQNKTI